MSFHPISTIFLRLVLFFEKIFQKNFCTPKIKKDATSLSGIFSLFLSIGFGVRCSILYKVHCVPTLLQSAIEELKKLDNDDLMLVISNTRRLNKDK